MRYFINASCIAACLLPNILMPAAGTSHRNGSTTPTTIENGIKARLCSQNYGPHDLLCLDGVERVRAILSYIDYYPSLGLRKSIAAQHHIYHKIERNAENQIQKTVALYLSNYKAYKKTGKVELLEYAQNTFEHTARYLGTVSYAGALKKEFDSLYENCNAWVQHANRPFRERCSLRFGPSWKEQIGLDLMLGAPIHGTCHGVTT